MLHHLASVTESSFAAVPALLLILLPCLQAAHFSVSFEMYRGSPTIFECLSATIIDLLRPKSGSPTHGLRALEEIDCLTYPERCGGHPLQPRYDALDFSYLPNIRSIQARAVEDASVSHWAMSPPDRPSITSLSLKQSCVRADTLRQLLRATPNLQTLDYEYQCDFQSPLTPAECPVLNCNALRDVLDKVSSSIESLSLSISFYSEDIWDDQMNSDYDGNLAWGISGSLGSMNHFMKLKYLKAPLVMLVGFEPPTSSLLEHRLPGNLRELCCSNELCQLYNFGWEDSDVLRQMFPLIRNRSGSLQKLQLDAKYTYISFLWWPQIRMAIEAACNEAGVAYSVIECPFAHA